MALHEGGCVKWVRGGGTAWHQVRHVTAAGDCRTGCGKLIIKASIREQGGPPEGAFRCSICISNADSLNIRVVKR
jgi:hypothetical protein